MKNIFLILIVCFVYSPISLADDSVEKIDNVFMDIDFDDIKKGKEINLDDIEFDVPEECFSSQVSCEEEAKVHINIEKKWIIKSVENIDSDNLTSDEFANTYPNITVDKINKASNPEDIMLLQRVLYDRGMLDVLPTGVLGAKTEKAILHFQAIKGIEYFENNRVVANEDTIVELNSLKNRMKDPNYLLNTSVPEIKDINLTTNQEDRLELIDVFLDGVNRGEIKKTYNVIEDKTINLNENPNGDYGMKLRGFVRIEE